MLFSFYLATERKEFGFCISTINPFKILHVKCFAYKTTHINIRCSPELTYNPLSNLAQQKYKHAKS